VKVIEGSHDTSGPRFAGSLRKWVDCGVCIASNL
jgi:hypothetical protein